MSIDPKTNNYVPGGKWLAAPGIPRESGVYALAMAMATKGTDIRPLCWSSETLERRFYDAPRAVQSDHLNFGSGNEHKALSPTNLGDIINVTIHTPATSTPISSLKDTLGNTFETLSSGIKDLTLTIEKHLESEKSLCIAMDKLAASLERATQTQAYTSFENVINDRAFMTDFEDTPTASTP